MFCFLSSLRGIKLSTHLSRLVCWKKMYVFKCKLFLYHTLWDKEPFSINSLFLRDSSLWRETSKRKIYFHHNLFNNVYTQYMIDLLRNLEGLNIVLSDYGNMISYEISYNNSGTCKFSFIGIKFPAHRIFPACLGCLYVYFIWTFFDYIVKSKYREACICRYRHLYVQCIWKILKNCIYLCIYIMYMKFLISCIYTCLCNI